MHIIGLDLALTSAHTAVVMDADGTFLTPTFEVSTCPASLDALLQRARHGAAADAPLAVLMEPTGLAWLPVASYLARAPQVTVYLVTSQRVADLRRFYQLHVKSDRVDARVLAKLYVVAAERLHPLVLPSAEMLALQRACKHLDWLSDQLTAIKNKLTDLDRAIWLTAWHGLGFSDPFGPAAAWCRQHYYDPTVVRRTGADGLRQAWQASQLDPPDSGAWAEALVTQAAQVLVIYGADRPAVDFAAVQAEARALQQQLDELAAEHHRWQLTETRPRYRRLHPTRHLESLKGVGQDSAAVFVSFIYDIRRFDDASALRGWSGLVPRSAQSSDSEAKGTRLSQAGPDLVKKYLFLDAEVARRYDPPLAALYYDQMVHKGKHHTQAVCAVATHLLDRIGVLLQDDRPYELRDVDGTPVSDAEARRIIAERYTVPAEVRQRNNRRARRARDEQAAERQATRPPNGKGKSARSVRG